MSDRARSRVGRLITLGGVAILIAAVFALARRGLSGRAEAVPKPAGPLKSGTPELVTYVIGYGLALILTIAAFALVHWHWAQPSTALGIVFALAFVQIVVHFRCFLHVTLHGPARDDLQLIVFSTLIILLMVGGTLVVLFNLRMRMM